MSEKDLASDVQVQPTLSRYHEPDSPAHSDKELKMDYNDGLTTMLTTTEGGNDLPLIGDVPQLTPEEERRLYRKIDLRIMPVMTILYLCSQIDRGNIGNAKIEGLVTQLHLTGNQFNIALTMFFIPYCLLEFPANMLLRRFRPSRWLAFITILWGTVMTLMGLVTSYAQLVGVRACLGVAEAGLFPGVAYLLTFWYPRHMLNLRIGIFFGAASIAGAFSGLLAYGISFMNGVGGKEGWSWIFILEGLVTVVVGVIAYFTLVDYPGTSSFLTKEERIYIACRQRYDISVAGEIEHFSWDHLWEVLKDWQMYVHIVVYMSIIGPLYGIVFFLPTIVNNFGFSVPNTQLLTVPCYVTATCVLLTFAYFSDKFKARSPFIVLGLCLTIIGYSIQISNASHGAKYVGAFFCISGGYATFPSIVSWVGNNMVGQYKRGIGMAVHIGLGNFSGAMFSNVYRTRDAPGYKLGHGMAIMFACLGLIATAINVIAYTRINAKRDKIMAEYGGEDGIRQKYTLQQLRDMGDQAPCFRYTL